MGSLNDTVRLDESEVIELTKQVEHPPPKSKPDDLSTSVFMFVSYDIVDSTLMKQVYEQWRLVYDQLIRHGAENLLEPTSVSSNYGIGNTNLKPWKAIGDEIVFCGRVQSFIEVVNYIKEVRKDIDVLEDKLSGNGNDTTIVSKRKVRVKATIWLALATDKPNLDKVAVDETHMNYAIKHQFTQKGEYVLDFSGIDIDEGFRLAANSSPQQILIDPKIAYLVYSICHSFGFDEEPFDGRKLDLSKSPDKIFRSELHISEDHDEFSNALLRIRNNLGRGHNADNKHLVDFLLDVSNMYHYDLRLIEYINPKSVWLNKPYPVIWYKPTVNKVPYDRKQDLVKKDTIGESIAEIKHIYDQLGKHGTVKSLATYLVPAYETEDPESMKRNIDKGIILYFITACVYYDSDANSDKLVVFKRSNNNLHNVCFWDFGNTNTYEGFKLTEEVSISGGFREGGAPQLIEKFYMDQVGISISVEVDTLTRTVKPFGLVNVTRNKTAQPDRVGIICLARVDMASRDEILNAFISQLDYDTKKPKYCDVGYLEKNDSGIWTVVPLDSTRSHIELVISQSTEDADEKTKEVKDAIDRMNSTNGVATPDQVHKTTSEFNYILEDYTKWAERFLESMPA